MPRNKHVDEMIHLKFQSQASDSQSPPRLFDILICLKKGKQGIRGNSGILQIGSGVLSTELLTYKVMDAVSKRYYGEMPILIFIVPHMSVFTQVVDGVLHFCRSTFLYKGFTTPMLTEPRDGPTECWPQCIALADSESPPSQPAGSSRVTTNPLTSLSVSRTLTPSPRPASRSPSISPWGPSVWGRSPSPLLPSPPSFTTGRSPSPPAPMLRYGPQPIRPFPMTCIRSSPTTETPSAPALVPFPEIPPIFATQYSATSDDSDVRVHDTPFLDAWTDCLRAQQSDVNAERIGVHASSIQVAARGLWSAIMALANNTDLPEPEAGCDVNHFTMDAIMNGIPRVSVGDSVGDGVLRAIWSTMWNDILSLGHGPGERFWTNDNSDFMTISLRPNILATRITEDDQAYLRGCGLSIRISVIWGLMPGPLSPSLLLYLAHGNIDKAISRDFLKAVQPSLEARLQTWPPSMITRSGQTVLELDVRRDPWTLIASCTSFDGTQIVDLATLTDSLDIVAVDQQLRLSVVFGSNADSISKQARIDALRSGIDLTLIPDTIPFVSLFDSIEEGDEPESDEIVATIDGVIKDIYAGRIVMSPQQVIRRLSTRSTEDQQQPAVAWNEQLDYPRLEGLFMAHLRRYILGGDGTDRACKFVKLLCGDEYLPLSPLGTLTIKFVPFINEHGAEVFAHTCFHQLDVLIDEHIVPRVNKPLWEDLSIHTTFDAAMDAICSVQTFTGE
ncbi:hypothetical protein EDB86DRAFT_1099203 [Lactarius hatsudake]|nr:hypothetical protein EDB86DRAFT_1099203 [Lactarius hatsudake]